MAPSVHCTSCGQDVTRPAGPDPRCPICQAPLLVSAEAQQAGPPARAASRSSIAAAQPPTLPRQPAAPAPAATRSGKPAARSTDAKGGLPILPIAAGVVLVIAIATYSLTRVSPGSQSGQAPLNGQLRVQTIGRPPESVTPSRIEPENTGAVVVMDLPEDRIPVSREQRRAAERKAAERQPRVERPAPAPARELARAEKPQAVAHAAPAPVPVAPAPAAEPEPPPLPPPPQPAAAEPPAEPPTASAPLVVGPTPTGAGAGFQKPRLATPGCVAISLQMRRDVEDFAGESAVVRFLVDESGKVSQFSVLKGPSDQRLATAIWSSIQRCDWTPGRNAQGNAVAFPVTMPFNFGR